MHLTQSISNSQPTYYMSGLLSGTVGMLVIVNVLTSPINNKAEIRLHAMHRDLDQGYVTPDTQQLSMIKVGLLQANDSTLIGDAARSVIGTAGLTRLQSFFQLQGGWDGKSSKPIDLKSVEVFSSFFSDTGLRPKQLGIFMSAQGNVVVNWPDQDNRLVELEFLPNGVDYFIESSGEEGTVPKGDIGFSKLMIRLAKPAKG